MGPTDPPGPAQGEDLLRQAEALEKAAAAARVGFYRSCEPSIAAGGRLLDVGCGNGDSVAEWRAAGIRAIGVDASFYRLSRWAALRRRLPLALADAANLPFADGAFETAIASGLLEHVGVEELSNPYRITARPEKPSARARVVAELLRVVASGRGVYLDGPNGDFPVDFWHGDRVGAFRPHRVPDTLCPSLGELEGYARAASAELTLLPVGERLRFRQIAHRSWGRLLAPAARAALRFLDALPRGPLRPLLARLYPFLVVRVERRASAR
ncbi:MAG: class I SAM-dependent methyltransferase [Thermoanaerobaculia bacterium]